MKNYVSNTKRESLKVTAAKFVQSAPHTNNEGINPRNEGESRPAETMPRIVARYIFTFPIAPNLSLMSLDKDQRLQLIARSMNTTVETLRAMFTLKHGDFPPPTATLLSIEKKIGLTGPPEESTVAFPSEAQDTALSRYPNVPIQFHVPLSFLAFRL